MYPVVTKLKTLAVKLNSRNQQRKLLHKTFLQQQSGSGRCGARIKLSKNNNWTKSQNKSWTSTKTEITQYIIHLYYTSSYTKLLVLMSDAKILCERNCSQFCYPGAPKEKSDSLWRVLIFSVVIEVLEKFQSFLSLQDLLLGRKL